MQETEISAANNWTSDSECKKPSNHFIGALVPDCCSAYHLVEAVYNNVGHSLAARVFNTPSSRVTTKPTHVRDRAQRHKSGVWTKMHMRI